jgi:hypothetical protein
VKNAGTGGAKNPASAKTAANKTKNSGAAGGKNRPTEGGANAGVTALDGVGRGQSVRGESARGASSRNAMARSAALRSSRIRQNLACQA